VSPTLKAGTRQERVTENFKQQTEQTQIEDWKILKLYDIYIGICKFLLKNEKG